MSSRPGESAATWFERAIATNSVAAAQQEEFRSRLHANPAAWDAVAHRAQEAAADLALAEAAFRAERAAATEDPQDPVTGA